MRRSVLTACLGGLAVALGAPAAPAASTAQVALRDVAFSPSTVRIARGGQVRWTWRDGVTPHDVTSRGNRRFRSARARLKGTYTVRFATPGTYRYVCTIHFGMAGKGVVR